MTSKNASSPKAKRRKRTKDEAGNASLGTPSYAKSYLRVSKDNLYMIIALWMEDFVEEAPKDHNKVGAVLVLPNDVIWAADCSRDDVHAVARLLMKHYDKAKGCKMFMSRKPCPMCAKLLVQSKVERVLFLPFEPEYYRSPRPFDPNAKRKTRRKIKINEEINESNKTQMKQVDSMFTASAIAQTRFVLQVEKQVLNDSVAKAGKISPKRKQQIKKENVELTKKYDFSLEWIESIEDDLPWPAFDKEVRSEVLEYFKHVMEWMARAIALRGRELSFELKKSEITDNDGGNDAFDPVSNPSHADQARHFLAIARFLAERTDDPKTGVGAVIVSPEMQILALGWNGFPLKALYGEFGRGSDDDDSEDKKYPYVIHAEQNALLMRNNKNIKGAILFVTKSPCNECVPLIAMEGIETVVVDVEVSSPKVTTQKKVLDYKMFPDMVKSGKFVCFQTRELQAGRGANKASKRLFK